MGQMIYVSTRGEAEPIDFDRALLTGLAPDGGLYVPREWPCLLDSTRVAGRPYGDVAAEVVSLFGKGPHFCETAWDSFLHPAKAPLTQHGPDDWVLELHHGPTLAFKDVAMQWLGPMFSSRLAAEGRRMTIVAATSGDTGGAAIEAMAGRDGITICVLHPHGRISEVQRRFMTTVEADNVLNLAVEGNFDDCQALVKAMFADTGFRDAVSLGAVNSINWARIVAQTVYYVTTAATLSRDGQPVHYAVPTGNFGDIFAGYVAKQMGAPIGQLIVATNENDILDRTLRTGSYTPTGVVETRSPSMDIQVSSNFERAIWTASGQDSALVRRLMGDLRETGAFSLPDDVLERLRADFRSARAAEIDVDARMKSHYVQTGQLVDPHTAVGLEAAAAARREGLEGPLVTLSTAHPAKFPGAVAEATGAKVELPPRCRDLYARDEHLEVVPNDYDAVTARIRDAFGA